MLHAVLATIGALAVLASVVAKVVMWPQREGEEGSVAVMPATRGDDPYRRDRSRMRERGRVRCKGTPVKA